MTLQRRTPLRRTPIRRKPLKVRAGAQPDTVRARKGSGAEREFKRAVLERDPWCSIKNNTRQPCDCGGRSVHAHHIAGRVGLNAHDPSNGIGLCSAHHRYVHDHPEESYERGWMKHRNGVQS